MTPRDPTLADTTAKGQSDSISFELELRHSPRKVWRALTEPELLSQWLLPAIGFELAPGSAFSLQAPPLPGWDGLVSCEILEVAAMSVLRYRWVVGELDTIVTFRLAATATGSRLSIVQSGFRPGQQRNFGGARYGWRLMGGRLFDLLASLPGDPDSVT